MIRIETNTRATEDIITDNFVPVAQQLWDEAIEKGAPLYSPEEIADVFPDLNKDSQRQALLRVANKQNTEEGEHVRAVIAFTNMIRAADDYNECWDIFVSNVFPNISKKLRRQYFIDIYTKWCYPCKVAGVTVDGFIADSSKNNKYLKMIYTDISNISEDDLDELGKNFIKLRSEYSTKDDRASMQAVEQLSEALDMIEIIEYIMEGDLMEAWDLVSKNIYPKEFDAAPTMLELMRVFYKK